MPERLDYVTRDRANECGAAPKLVRMVLYPIALGVFSAGLIGCALGLVLLVGSPAIRLRAIGLCLVLAGAGLIWLTDASTRYLNEKWPQ